MNDSFRFREVLVQRLSGIFEPTEEQLRRLSAHYEYLTRWNKTLNLTAIRDLEAVVHRHYGESIVVALRLPARPLVVADIGSGAGFPGVPMAIIRPECRFALVESNSRKAAFLKESCRGLPNLTVLPVRAETLEVVFDWLVSRAVRWENVLRLIPKLSTQVALLVGKADSVRVRSDKRLVWDPPALIPWSRHSVLMVGRYVSRGT